MLEFRERKEMRVVQDPYTMVVLEQDVKLPNGENATFVGYGFAKRHPNDAPNKTIGIEVATEKAKEQIRKKRRKAQQFAR